VRPVGTTTNHLGKAIPVASGHSHPGEPRENGQSSSALTVNSVALAGRGAVLGARESRMKTVAFFGAAILLVGAASL
jgi:hypothetical protein